MYVKVADLEGTLEKVRAAGSSVEHERTRIGETAGWWADVRDPAGMLLGVLTENAPA